MLFLGGLCQCIYFSIAAAKSPFGAMMVGFGFAGTANSYLSGKSLGELGHRQTDIIWVVMEVNRTCTSRHKSLLEGTSVCSVRREIGRTLTHSSYFKDGYMGATVAIIHPPLYFPAH